MGSHLTGTGAPYDPAAITTFERNVHKRVSLLEFSTPFIDCRATCTYLNFPERQFETIRSRGAIPFFSWSSASIPIFKSEPAFQLRKVARGDFDPYIRAWAKAAQDWNHPFFLRFNWEPNVTPFPWTVAGSNGNTNSDYVRSWRHVHRIFDEAGATNVTWVWCPYAYPGADPDGMRRYYPGDEYVDWTGLDVYNYGTPYRSFASLLRPYYDALVKRIAPGKPIVIAETGSTERNGAKDVWLAHMLRSVPRFTRVGALIYFDVYADHQDWPIETSPGALRAFRRGIGARAFLRNDFRKARTSPIPAP